MSRREGARAVADAEWVDRRVATGHVRYRLTQLLQPGVHDLHVIERCELDHRGGERWCQVAKIGLRGCDSSEVAVLLVQLIGEQSSRIRDLEQRVHDLTAIERLAGDT